MDRLYQTTIATPAGTSSDTPLVTNFALEDAELVSVTILIPDGHAGLTGIRVLQAGQEIIPWDNDDWLVSNNEVITIPMSSEITRTGLSIETYNQDIFPHTHWVRALITNLGSTAGTVVDTVPVIPSSILSDLGI